MRRKLVFIGLTVLAAGALVALTWMMVTRRAASAEIAAGRQLYAVHCAACHGRNLEGQPNWQTQLANGRLPAPPHDASGHTWHHSDAELFTIVQKGVSALVPGYASDMPAFEGVLTDDQAASVLMFIKSTWPDRERDYQARRSKPRP